ncbi:hypothetical protein GQ44DRAFT_755041 [Phaeosphaeriaceae sp. PMI808]|nr:hypothetical protein GQ44DRAFT_755041 [Phaeosphaeriaceae sp. PMI808]
MDPGKNSPSQAIMDLSLGRATEVMRQSLCNREASTGESIPHRQYTHSEWQSKKAVIKELYLDGGMSLKKVMEVLEKEPHSFRPTPRMYKQKLKSWGYFKNCTEERVRSVLYNKTAGCAVGKASAFSQDGEERDRKIKKYLERTKKTFPEFIETEDQQHVALDISFTTPPQAIPYDLDTDLSLTDSQSTQNGYEYNYSPSIPEAKRACLRCLLLEKKKLDLPPLETRYLVLSKSKNLELAKVSLEFESKVTWGLEALVSNIVDWLNNPTVSETSKVGTLSSPQFLGLIKPLVGENMMTKFQYMIYAISLAYTQNSRHLLSSLELHQIGATAGHNFLRVLDERLKPQSLKEYSVDHLRALFLMIFGTTLAVSYAEPVPEGPSIERQTRFRPMQNHLCQILAHYMIYLGSQLNRPITDDADQFILEEAPTRWYKEGAFLWKLENEEIVESGSGFEVEFGGSKVAKLDSVSAVVEDNAPDKLWCLRESPVAFAYTSTLTTATDWRCVFQEERHCMGGVTLLKQGSGFEFESESRGFEAVAAGGIKKYRCDHFSCGASFLRRWELMRHKRTQHPSDQHRIERTSTKKYLLV